MQGCVEWVSKYCRNLSLMQSLNECGGVASVATAKGAPSSYFARYSNLTQDTRISLASQMQVSEANSEFCERLESNATESRFKTISESKALDSIILPHECRAHVSLTESKSRLDSPSLNLGAHTAPKSTHLDSLDFTMPMVALDSILSGFLLSVFEIGSNILEHNFYHHKLDKSSKHRYWRDKHALRRHKIICKIVPRQVAFVFKPKYTHSFRKERNYANGRGMVLVFRFSKVSLARIPSKVCLKVSYGADRGDFKDSLARWHRSTQSHRKSQDLYHLFGFQTRARVLHTSFQKQR